MQTEIEQQRLQRIAQCQERLASLKIERLPAGKPRKQAKPLIRIKGLQPTRRQPARAAAMAGDPLSAALGAHPGFQQDPQGLNMALTVAKDQCVTLADLQVWANKCTGDLCMELKAHLPGLKNVHYDRIAACLRGELVPATRCAMIAPATGCWGA